MIAMWRVGTGIAHPDPCTYPEAHMLLICEDIHRPEPLHIPMPIGYTTVHGEMKTRARTDKASGMLVVVVGWDDNHYRCSPDGANDRLWALTVVVWWGRCEVGAVERHTLTLRACTRERQQGAISASRDRSRGRALIHHSFFRGNSYSSLVVMNSQANTHTGDHGPTQFGLLHALCILLWFLAFPLLSSFWFPYIFPYLFLKCKK